jgi:hypothetical protein
MSDDGELGFGGMTCCPLSGDESEGPSFSTTTVRAARKVHTCVECRVEIDKGTKYESTTGKWDGGMATFRTCLSCVEIRNHFACNGFVYGALWGDLEENFFPDMKAGGPCMKGLSPEAKQRLFDLRMKWLEERDADG